MLDPDQIERLGNSVQALVDPLTDWLVSEIAKRITEAGQLTSTAAYEVWRLQTLGKSQQQIKKMIQKHLNITSREVEQLLTQSADTGYRFDLRYLPSEAALPIAENTAVQSILSTAIAEANETLQNLYGTTAMGFITRDIAGVEAYHTIDDAIYKACDDVFLRVSTGAQDFNSAVRDATTELAKRGIVALEYNSGRKIDLGAHVRLNVMGGLGRMQEQISQQVHDDLGADGWEISAHEACAPDHEPIQGKQYPNAEYERLNGSLKRPIGRLNCGHSAHPIILGVSMPIYSARELADMRQENENGVDYEGRHYSTYEATQKQREIERAIRNNKRQAQVAEARGDSEAQNKYNSRLNVLNVEYSRFSRAAGLVEQRERTWIAGVKRKPPEIHENSYLAGIGSPKTDLNYIESDEYKAKFSSISDNPKLNRAIYERSRAAVTHQSGKFTEDISVVDLQGNLIGSTSSKVAYETQYSQSLKEKVLDAEPYSLVSIHDHGTNTPPSGADFASAGSKKYAFGIVACHDGSVYYYSTRKARPFTAQLYDQTVDKFRKSPYNYNEIKAYTETLKQFEKFYGIEWRKL